MKMKKDDWLFIIKGFFFIIAVIFINFVFLTHEAFTLRAIGYFLLMLELFIVAVIILVDKETKKES